MIKEKESNFEADLSKTVNKWKFSQAEIERLN